MGHYVNFKEELQQRTDYAEEVIRRWLPEERGFSKTMAQAMNYSMCAGGKRLRPILLLETLRLFGGDEKLAEPFMAGIEMIHTHSLIHDDLPAIDNDDYRRGRLTTHKVYGQSVDVENDGKPLEKDLLDYIYEHKTSALIEASMMAGAVLAGADEEQTSMIEQAASDIGLAFQIQDDILDVTSTSQELGKPVHSDEKNNKVTYVTLFGVQKASEQVRELSEKALAVLDRLYNKNEFLTELVMEMATRRK